MLAACNKGLLYMNNLIDYHSIMLARKLFHQSQEQARAAATAKKNQTGAVCYEDIIPDSQKQDNALSYPVFHNPACGYLDGTETQHHDQAFKQRWQACYRAHPQQLPQHANLEKLQAHKRTLERTRAQLYAPRLAALTIAAFISSLLFFHEEWLLLMLPALFVLIVWGKTHAAIQENTQHIQQLNHLIAQQQELLTVLESKLTTPACPATIASTFRQAYTLRLESFLHDSITEFFPSLDGDELKSQLRSNETKLFLLESPAILQLPPISQPSADNHTTLETLIQQGGKSLYALHILPELEGVARLHYLYGILCFEEGVLVCTGVYDWIGDCIHGEQRDFYPYRDLMHIHRTETHFPKTNPLPTLIPDEVYQQQFSQTVQIVSLGLCNRTQHSCTLPKIQVPSRTYLNSPGNTFTPYLKRDPRQLVATLTTHLIQHGRQNKLKPQFLYTKPVLHQRRA